MSKFWGKNINRLLSLQTIKLNIDEMCMGKRKCKAHKD